MQLARFEKIPGKHHEELIRKSSLKSETHVAATLAMILLVFFNPTSTPFVSTKILSPYRTPLARSFASSPQKREKKESRNEYI
jgi:hypothetical protein